MVSELYVYGPYSVRVLIKLCLSDFLLLLISTLLGSRGSAAKKQQPGAKRREKKTYV